MARKAKKKLHPMPKLSALDKTIYWLLFILLAALWTGLFFGAIALRKHIALADEMVVAKEDHASMFWIFPGWLAVFLSTFISWYIPYEARRPIFGKKGVRYGPPAYPKVYPLFMKDKPKVWVSENQKKTKRGIAWLVVLVVLVCCLPMPLGLYGRDVLRADGSISDYNMFGSEVRQYDSGDAETVTFATCLIGGGKVSRSRMSVKMEFKMKDGKHYAFESRDFLARGQGVRFWLAEMTRLKTRFSPERIRFDGAEDLYWVVRDLDLTEQETQTLYDLFEREME